MKNIGSFVLVVLCFVACKNASSDQASTQIGKSEIVAKLSEVMLPDACDVYFSLRDVEQICQDSFDLKVSESEVEGKNCVREYISRKGESVIKIRINQYASNAAVRSAFNVVKKELGGTATGGGKSQKGTIEETEALTYFRYFIQDKYLVMLKSLDKKEPTCLNESALEALAETLVKRLGEELPQ